MSAVFRNVAYNFAGQVLPMAVAVVAMPVLVRDAGAARLGFLGLAWALIGYFALLDLGLSRVVTRRVALADSRRALAGETRILLRLCGRLFVLVAAISGLLAVTVPAHALVGQHADPVVVEEARMALLILWATLPFTVVTGLLRGALEGLQEFGRTNLLRGFFGVLSFAAPLVVLGWSNALGPLTASIAIGRVLSLFVHATWAFQSLHRHETAHRRSVPATSGTPINALALLREGGWLTVSNVVGPMMVTFDRFAIASLISLAAASYYFVPQEVSLRMLVVPSAIATTIFPMLARSDGPGAHRRRIAVGALEAVAASCLLPCAVLAAFAAPLLSLWMGPAFAGESAPVTACLAAGLFANCCAQVPFAWLQAAGRADVTGKLHLIQLPIYAILLLLLITRFGIVGAAVAWSTRTVVDAALLFVAADRLLPDMRVRSTLPPIIAGGGCLALLATTPVIGDPSWRTSTSLALLVASIAVATWIGLRLRLTIRR